MIQIAPETLFSSERFYLFSSLVNSPYGIYPYIPTSASPAMLTYVADNSVGNSTNSNTIELGTKTFSYYGSPIVAAGDLIRAESYSDTVHGYMLGKVTSFYSSAGISNIVVDVYEAHGIGTSLQWYITMQLNRGYNVVQNPNAPHLAKLKVPDYNYSLALASFNVPVDFEITSVVTADTPTHQAGYTTTSWRSSTYVEEDCGDLHEPWLGTTLTVQVKIKKQTITYVGGEYITVDEYSYRNYTHTFTLADFDEYSDGFVPGATLPDNPSPSTCTIQSSTPIDSFVSTYDQTYDVYGNLLTSVIVIYSFDTYSYITEVSPGSFFEPPTP